MKILILSHISDLLGGAERSMLDTLDVWASKHGIEPQFIMRQPIKGLAPALEERGWEYHALDYGFWCDASPPKLPEDIFRNAVRNSRAVQDIETIIQEFQPGIVATNSVVCPWAALAAHYQSVPHVWFVREYGDLDHGRTYEIGREQALADVGNLSELVVANSQTLEKHLSQYIDKDKLTTLYTPFNLDKITERAKQPVKNPYHNPESLKLITTNNIAPTKGQAEAAEAVGKLVQAGEEVELCVMGTGDKSSIETIQGIARRYGAQNKIHLIGSQPDTIPYIALADVGIMASRQEAFGRATFECLAASRPVVGTNSGATSEMVEPDVNGYLYDPGDSDGLTKQLRNYIHNPELLSKHGKSAYQTSARMMSGDHNTEALYERILQTIQNKDTPQRYQPIHYLHRWLDYVQIGQQAMDHAHTFTFHRIMKQRLKRRLRRPYFYLRGRLARMTGE